MNLVSTVTSKGQVLIPKLIRDQFGLLANTRVFVDVAGDQIVLSPAPTVAQMAGFIKNKRKYADKSDREVVRAAVLRKYGRH